jgi:outer membrane protein assembly factor BamE
MKSLRGFRAGALVLGLVPIWSGCGFEPYKIDIQQGNVITQEMVSKLKPGMTRSQVTFILGTPLVSDPFRPERWDYVYEFIHRGKVKDRRRLTLVFENDLLKTIGGDVSVAAPSPQGEAVPSQAAAASAEAQVQP